MVNRTATSLTGLYFPLIVAGKQIIGKTRAIIAGYKAIFNTNIRMVRIAKLTNYYTLPSMLETSVQEFANQWNLKAYDEIDRIEKPQTPLFPRGGDYFPFQFVPFTAPQKVKDHSVEWLDDIFTRND